MTKTAYQKLFERTIYEKLFERIAAAIVLVFFATLVIAFAWIIFILLTRGITSEEKARLNIVNECVAQEIYTPEQCLDIVTGRE